MEGTTERWAEGPTVLESIWRYHWLVVGGALLLGLGGFVLSMQQTTMYRAVAQIYLTDPGSSDVFGQRGNVDLERYIPQQAERLRSGPVLTAAAEDLDGVSPGGLEERLEVEGDVGLGTLSITVEDDDPERAAASANALMAAYEEDVRAFQLGRAERAADELQAAEADIQARIDELTAEEDAVEVDPTAQGQLGVLAQRLVEIDTLSQQLRVDARLFGSGVEFVEPAEVPGAPFAPTPRRTAAAFGLLGAVLASAAAYWLAGRGQRVAGRDDPASVLGVPLLGALPTYDVGKAASLRERTMLDPRTAEAYRFVQSSMARLLREMDARSVLITSAGPNTGKTETALQIAVTANGRGSRVLLVDADVRMRGLTSFLRAERDSGLLDLGHDAPQGPADLVTHYPVSEGPDLAVLTAGTVEEGELAQVQESWFGHAVPDLVDRFDLTIFDSPPLLAVADTATVAAYTDAVILVVREGSSLTDLARVRQRMRFVGQRLIGYVYLTSDALDDAAFDYGLVRSRGNLRVSRGATPETAERTHTSTRPSSPADGFPGPRPSVDRGDARPETSVNATSRPEDGTYSARSGDHPPVAGDKPARPARGGAAVDGAGRPAPATAHPQAIADRRDAGSRAPATPTRPSDSQLPFSDIARHFRIDDATEESDRTEDGRT